MMLTAPCSFGAYVTSAAGKRLPATSTTVALDLLMSGVRPLRSTYQKCKTASVRSRHENHGGAVCGPVL
jgi:hypothetical protein